MFVHDTLLNRLKRGCETIPYPAGPAPALPDRHGGALRVEADKCPAHCADCVTVCPTGAITRPSNRPVALDLGRCIFCAECIGACPVGAITRTADHRMAVRQRADLVLGAAGKEQLRLASALDGTLRRLFGRSLKLRQVSAGGCNACEADTHVLGTIGWDLGRFGIQFVASPRHADGLLITGPVTRNMELALRKTWEAVPPPKLVIAVGACAIAGGPFVGHPQVKDGVTDLLPVDLFIPGCPPHPLTLLDGLLRLLGRLEESERIPLAKSAQPPAPLEVNHPA
jgi:Ni,Fe-hydrogenase III small subunit/NAD-dependent dihydropyrimidine dehydrogenase PreA subunit